MSRHLHHLLRAAFSLAFAGLYLLLGIVYLLLAGLTACSGEWFSAATLVLLAICCMAIARWLAQTVKG